VNPKVDEWMLEGEDLVESEEREDRRVRGRRVIEGRV